MFEVYGLIDIREPDRVRYVGQTTQTLNKRLFGHWKTTERQEKPKLPVHKWMKKRSRDQVLALLLESCSSKLEMDAAEVRWIKRLREEGQADLNISEGGNGNSGYKHSDEFKKALSERMRGTRNPLYGIKRPATYGRAVGVANASRTPKQKATQAEKVGKLTPDSVRQVRHLYRCGFMSMQELAHVYGVSQANIWNIVRNKTWRHVV